ncbi:flavoprotein [Brenneria tiliae]|uniref:flavoprotein n=1 Tax=Brenneria tiliae TaxID=2914984 RepID=UPI002014D4BC|nr:flavoprotein [Brenneria tiliae]MCL2899654.1 flavoprotein [Brenneria tiliae]MCL2904032.1 flavoprotein [Brenneria tiliae]
MNSQTLSLLIDDIIAEIMADKVRHAIASPRPALLVAITGDDAAGFPATLRYLTALERGGYALYLLFSHSAQSLGAAWAGEISHALPRARQLTEKDIEPAHWQNSEALLLPALSSNSLAKIALGIGDNLAGRMVFQALAQNLRIMATLNRECDPARQASVLPAAYLAQLRRYVDTLQRIGIHFITPRASAGATLNRPFSHPADLPRPGGGKRLITQREVRLHDARQALYVDADVLITPAARDEIANRKITLITHPQEAACIWQQ